MDQNMIANYALQIEYQIQILSEIFAFANLDITILKINQFVLNAIRIVKVALQQMFIAYLAMMDIILININVFVNRNYLLIIII